MIALLVFVIVAAHDTARFAAIPAIVNAGDSVVLDWRLPGTDSAYITRLGKVPPVGHITVRPARSREYLLVSEDANGRASVLSASVVVREASPSPSKGELPAAEAAFAYQRSFTVAASSIQSLLGTIDSVLQARFSYPASDWVRKPSGVWIISTEPKERPDLIGRNDATVGARRVAYRVEITDRAGKGQLFQCSVAAAVQYRKRVERAFYPESADSLYEREVEGLAQGLGWLRGSGRSHDQSTMRGPP
jgi:hypothetical protein